MCKDCYKHKHQESSHHKHHHKCHYCSTCYKCHQCKETNKGDQGPAGPQGPQGPAGPSGGGSGTQGPIGPQGQQGPVGPQGPIGPQGNDGPQGAPGGPNGLQGPIGPQGIMGPAGTVAGPQGPIGPQGPQGTAGPAGTVAGPQGPIGPQGGAGPQGPVGNQGAVGPTGGVSQSVIHFGNGALITSPIGPIGPSGPIGPTDPFNSTKIAVLGFGSNNVIPSSDVVGGVFLTDVIGVGGFTFVVPFNGIISDLEVAADITVSSNNNLNTITLQYDFYAYDLLNAASFVTNNGIGHANLNYHQSGLTTSLFFGNPIGFTAVTPFFMSAANINNGSFAVVAGDRVGVYVQPSPNNNSDTPASGISAVNFSATFTYTKS